MEVSTMPASYDFAEIYNTHHRRILQLCRYLLNSPDAAEDAAHEVFLKAHRALHTYDSSLPFSSWLSGIASHHCVDILRRRTTETRIFDISSSTNVEPPSTGSEPLIQLISAEQGESVRAALASMPDRYRVPLVLLYYNEFSYDEIGEVLGLTRNHVATLIFRGKKQLRRILSEGGIK